MNIEQARNDLDSLGSEDNLRKYQEEAWDRLEAFIDDVEQLLKHNSIKQTAALFKKPNDVKEE